ncbi:MAG: fibronectin type III domain-containing protein, partial [Bacteroidia bacterium]
PTRTCTSTVAGSILGATDSGVTASGCGGTDDDDVWYSFVATSTTHHIELLSVAGSTTDLYHAVYSGGCGSLGAAILCSDANTSVATGLTPGNTYYLQIYSWGSTSGQNTTFNICISTDPACTTPGSQASGFIAGTITSNSFPATFSGTADSYLVIRSTSATPPSAPVNGVVYTGANIGTLGAGLTLVQSGTSTTILGTGLTGNTRYYYYIYAYNNTACSGGPLYNASGPLTGNAVTCPASPSPVNTASTLTSINFSWPSSLGGGINAVTYQLQVTTDAGFTANVAGSPFTINDPTTSQNVTGLTSNTTYYYRIRANNGCWSAYTSGTATTGYCAFTSSSNTYWISNFSTTGGSTNINRNSNYTAGGYANYSGTDIVTQILGQSFNFSTTMSSGTHGINIYVDWNNDLDFNDAGELV